MNISTWSSYILRLETIMYIGLYLWWLSIHKGLQVVLLLLSFGWSWIPHLYTKERVWTTPFNSTLPRLSTIQLWARVWYPMGSNGFPVVLIWIHVDDIFNQSSTPDTLKKGLDHIMAISVKPDLVCHTYKTSPPSHIVIYCVYIWYYIHSHTTYTSEKIEQSRLDDSFPLV